MLETVEPAKDSTRVIPSYESLDEVDLNGDSFLFRSQGQGFVKFLGSEYAETNAIRVGSQIFNHPSVNDFADAVKSRSEEVPEDKQQELIDRTSTAFLAELETFNPLVEVDVLVRLNEKKPEGYQGKIENRVKRLYQDAQVTDINMQAFENYLESLKGMGISLSDSYAHLHALLVERTIAIIDVLSSVERPESIGVEQLREIEKIEEKYILRKRELGQMHSL